MENYTSLIYGGLSDISVSTVVFGGARRVFGDRAKHGYRDKLIKFDIADSESEKLSAINLKPQIHFGKNESDEGIKNKIIRKKQAPKVDKRITTLLKAKTKQLLEYMAKEYKIQEPMELALIELIATLTKRREKPVDIDGEIGFLLDKVGDKYFQVVPSSEKVPRTLRYLAKSLLSEADELKIASEPELIDPEFPELSESLKNKIDNWSQPDDDNQSNHIKALIAKEGSLVEYVSELEKYYIDVARDLKTLIALFDAKT